jgi:hypothetical protein
MLIGYVRVSKSDGSQTLEPQRDALIFHTAVGMTRALDSLTTDGHGAAITPDALAGTSPHLNEHLNRFGSYELDLSKPPAPLPFELPPRGSPHTKAQRSLYEDFARIVAMVRLAPQRQECPGHDRSGR